MDRITVTQAAKELGVTRARVHALIGEGRIRAEKVGMQYLIRPKDLDKVRERKTGRPRKATAD